MKPSVPYEDDLLEDLRQPETARHYLQAAAEEGDVQVLLLALSDVARAQGMKATAQKAGLGRESLYKALSGKRKPNIETVAKVLSGMGLRLSVQAV